MGKWADMKRRPQVIQGMKLGTLLRVLARNDFRVDTTCLGRLAYLVILGVFNSMYARCETFFNGREIESSVISQPPIFVLGHWRSGTTHLHNLLSLDENFATPSAYQALFPHHFLFSQVGGLLFDLLAPTKRPMDNVAFAAGVPHEDEFALAAATGISPYLAALFPVTGDSCHAQLDPLALPKDALEAWKDAFVLFLKKVTLSEEKRIVLKSPPHLGRVGTLLEMFSDAKFVHIVRDPYLVYASTHKLWRDSFRYAHLQIPSHQMVDDMILSWYPKLFALFERDRPRIPARSLFEMKFEDLEAAPLETLRDMYLSLGLEGFEPFSRRVSKYLDSLNGYEKNVHRIEEGDRAKVATAWSDTFERYGYPIKREVMPA